MDVLVCMKKQNAKVISTKDMHAHKIKGKYSTLLELHTCNLVMLAVVSQQLAVFKTQEVKGTF